MILSGMPFFLFLFHFTVDTERSDRSHPEARFADFVTAFLADAEISIFDTVEGILDLVDQLALAVADAQFKVAVGFLSSAVSRVGKI